MNKTPKNPNRLRVAIPLLFSLSLSALSALPVRVLPWDDQIAAMRLALIDSSGSKEIDGMHPTKRTKTYQVSPSEEGLSVEVVGKVLPDGKPCREKLVIPKNAKRPLVLVLPDAKSSSGIRLHVFEDDDSGFPWGSTRLINATGKKLAFAAEKKAVELPVSWTPVMVNPGGADRNMEVRLFYRERPKEPFYSAVWEYNKEVRTLVFLVPGTDSRLGPVAMKMIPEDRRLLTTEGSAKP